MNPVVIFGIIIGLVVAYYGFFGDGGGILGSGGGPLAGGPGRGTAIQNPQPVYTGGYTGGTATGGSGSGSASPAASLKAGESPFKGVIRISTVERFGDRPENEYLTIRYDGRYLPSPARLIDVTGWRIATPRESEGIPRALNIPEIDADERDIFLPPGGEVIIVSGTPSYTRNFRENQCVGYLTEAHQFTPFLSSSCPDDNPSRTQLLRKGFNGQCVDVIEAIPSCRRPVGPLAAGIIGQACADYISGNFSYYSCVRDFRNDQDFLKKSWRTVLRRSRKLYDSRHDRIILRDQNGLLVDEFEY